MRGASNKEKSCPTIWLFTHYFPSIRCPTNRSCYFPPQRLVIWTFIVRNMKYAWKICWLRLWIYLVKADIRLFFHSFVNKKTTPLHHLNQRILCLLTPIFYIIFRYSPMKIFFSNFSKSYFVLVRCSKRLIYNFRFFLYKQLQIVSIWNLINTLLFATS